MLRGSVPTVDSKALHTFSRSPQANIPRSVFNRTHGCKTTFSEGYLIPVFVDEMLPGDTFNLTMHAFCRLSTLLFPIMDNLYLESFFFAVPNRIIWDNWIYFNGEQVNPGDSTDFVVPTLPSPAGGFVEYSLADYFGLPTGVENLNINSLPFRAYNLIYNEWFRDQNLQDSVYFDTGDGPDDIDNFNVKRFNKRYDYFTSCLPWPQKGPDVALPLGSTAPVIGTGAPTFSIGATTGFGLRGTGTTAAAYSAGPASGTNASWDVTNLKTDLTDATAATINDIRLAFQTQKLYERDARGGTRYTEIIRSHFGVISPDFRLQRPEYLGGGSTPIVINPVAQTSSTVSGSPLAELAAYGVCAPVGHGFTYSATEHCYVLGIVRVRADVNYQAGIERMWSRSTRLDFYWPALSHIGEQAVLNQEIYAQGTSADTEVFGYQERFAEYRYKPSIITGAFRSNASGTLDSWHLAQDFGSLPLLNPDFIIEDAPMGRIQAIDTQDNFLFDSVFQYKCARPLPTYSVPGLIDHF